MMTWASSTWYCLAPLPAGDIRVLPRSAEVIQLLQNVTRVHPTFVAEVEWQKSHQVRKRQPGPRGGIGSALRLRIVNGCRGRWDGDGAVDQLLEKGVERAVGPGQSPALAEGFVFRWADGRLCR